MSVQRPCEADERDILAYNLQLKNLGLPEQSTARDAVDALEKYAREKANGNV
jgi:hypothetical protein